MIKTSIAVVLFVLFTGTVPAQKLTGAGSTFSAPIYLKWFSEYDAAHPGVHISYDAVGSSRGIRQVTAGLVDFGATDGPMTDYQLVAARVKVMQIPTVLGAVVPIFNIPGISDIKFSPGVLAGIYLGEIQNWNDPRIGQDNPDMNLPDRKIVVVHRSDGSGTTYIFTDYLSKVSKQWAGGPGTGTAPEWPTGEGGKGNEGVASLVRKLPGAIGYVELTYAVRDHISYGEVKNAAGNWVAASVAGVAEAAAGLGTLPFDYRVSIANASGANAYPISSFTWLLIPLKPGDAGRSRVLKDFLRWIVTSGQKDASALSYAPLPQPIAEKVLASIATIK